MATRKKGKKSKWQAVPLTDLLPETPGGMPAMPVKTSSWADDVDDDHDMYSSRKPMEPVVLPTAPRAARGPGVDEENIPMNPPFVAQVSNLSYSVEEEDLLEFFAEMQISNLRLPKDTTKSRGYAFVDFEDRQSLIEALYMTNSSIKGRRVRIEVFDSSGDDRRGRMGMGRDYGRRDYDDADRNSDWRSGPRDEPSSGEGDRFRSRGGGGGFDRSERRDDRESSASDTKPGAWREARAQLPDLPDRSDRGGGGGFGERRGYRSDDKDRDYSRFGDRGSRDQDGGGERGGDRGGSGFGSRRNYGERDRERDTPGDWGNRLSSRPAASSDPPPESGPPRTRVKLNLMPRTKPIDPITIPKDTDADKPQSGEDSRPAASAPAATPVPAANIFGAAKPVDTTAREREIEERLAKTYAESKPKTDDGDRKGPKEGTWGRRNGEGRSDNDKERPRPAWRTDEDRGRMTDKAGPRQPGSGRSDQRNDSHGPPAPRSGGQAAGAARLPNRATESRGPVERERKDRDREDGVPSMPKATDEQAPNFVASNKYSMLPEDVDSDTSNN